MLFFLILLLSFLLTISEKWANDYKAMHRESDWAHSFHQQEQTEAGQWANEFQHKESVTKQDLNALREQVCLFSSILFILVSFLVLFFLGLFSICIYCSLVPLCDSADCEQ
jgi:1,4-dihydroxy-2-naphthoate octaprenyltransferase